MAAYQIRDARPEDLPAQREILRLCFGDSPEEADLYLRDAEGFGARSLVAEQDGRVISTITLLPGLTLHSATGERYACPYTYALGTLPEARGQGIGMALLLAMADSARAEAGFVCGAVFEKKLRDIYPRYVPMETMGRIREAAFDREELPAVPPPALTELSPEAYGLAREAFLRGRAHAEYAPGYLRLAARFGARFWQGPGLLAIAEPGEERCPVRELLTEPGGYDRAAAALAAAFPARHYRFRTPPSLRPEKLPREGEILDTFVSLGPPPSGEDFWAPLTLE